MSPTVLIERTGNLAQLVLNRPEVLNAIDNAMGEELGAACDELAAKCRGGDQSEDGRAVEGHGQP